MKKEYICIEGLNKKFGDYYGLKDIDLKIDKGKIYGIVGRNGSGKTVLLKCICGLMKPTSGKVLINGKEIGKDIENPEDLGMIIETPGFLYEYDAYNNLKFLAMIRKKIGKQKIIDTIRIVGLDPFSKKTVGKYSLGMRQRLGIAQAIMEDPELLVLDEPMNGLDNQGVDEIRLLLKEMNSNGKTIIIASHNKEDISILCDEIIQMDKGTITSRYKNFKEEMS